MCEVKLLSNAKQQTTEKFKKFIIDFKKKCKNDELIQQMLPEKICVVVLYIADKQEKKQILDAFNEALCTIIHFKLAEGIAITICNAFDPFYEIAKNFWDQCEEKGVFLNPETDKFFAAETVDKAYYLYPNTYAVENKMTLRHESLNSYYVKQ